MALSNRDTILRTLRRKRRREDDDWHHVKQIISDAIPLAEAKAILAQLADEGHIERFITTHNGPFYRAPVAGLERVG
jgi:hypothetical protein